ncbi:unnamed protein product [Didymodactylos carnosus]|uniref:Uncharacterized protein n=1 Tax=Didymodactylos carnosus TaxID=1234261 RepID=A0A815IFW9_9BILA|nr:unnamed protein product [Didymodactylos carnosus]CAF1365429.1 unnamed protein product [Didymodactylos carnosus]CAF4136705.1 unnamed protein product [Didymodactylos carnosus]CAF4247329.1 unnamed protein product [Didymodactylos carnosus]
MIDKMVQTNTTILHTNARISHVRLSMFELGLDLTDEFRFIIQHLPCCKCNETVEEYIREYIFKYYGYTYVTDLLLGGIAQQNVYITQEDRAVLEQNGYTITNEAQLSAEVREIFSASFKMKYTNGYNKTSHETFTKYVKTSSGTTLGGDTTIKSIEDWSKTVPSNPVAIKFGIKYLFNLLTKERFPNDNAVDKKLKLIEIALSKYLQDPLFCYNNCTSPTNGICKSSGYFRFGLCQCNKGFSGIDCSVPVTQPPKPDILSGTICGFRFGGGTDCDGVDPRSGCPSGYTGSMWLIGKTGSGVWNFSSKSDTDKEIAKNGTICGIFGTPCGGKNPLSDGCPTGYARYEWLTEWGNGRTAFCYKTDPNVIDASGTMCGLEINGGNGAACNGYHPTHGGCPPGFHLVQWLVDFGDSHIAFCVKD